MTTVAVEPVADRHLGGIAALARALGWPSYADAGRLRRALSAPGVTALAAVASGEVVGFVQVQSDGAIQAHLSAVAVRAGWRGRGVGRRLVGEAAAACGAGRVDAVAAPGSEPFYRALRHKEHVGFRLYVPD